MDAAHDASILRRRTSIGTPTCTIKPFSACSPTPTSSPSPSPSPSSLSSSFSSSSVDFELVSIKPTSYTSLRDILPSPASAIHSPKAPCFAAKSSYEISIRNRLVKQAAWAYLQPMSTFPEADGSTFFHRVWTQFSGAVLRLINTVFDCLLQSIQVGTSAYQL